MSNNGNPYFQTPSSSRLRYMSTVVYQSLAAPAVILYLLAWVVVAVVIKVQEDKRPETLFFLVQIAASTM